MSQNDCTVKNRFSFTDNNIKKYKIQEENCLAFLHWQLSQNLRRFKKGGRVVERNIEYYNLDMIVIVV